MKDKNLIFISLTGGMATRGVAKSISPGVVSGVLTACSHTAIAAGLFIALPYAIDFCASVCS